MIDHDRITAEHITDDAGRRAALEVLGATYQKEKQWISEAEQQIPASDLARDDIVWFVVRMHGVRPACCACCSTRRCCNTPNTG